MSKKCFVVCSKNAALEIFDIDKRKEMLDHVLGITGKLKPAYEKIPSLIIDGRDTEAFKMGTTNVMNQCVLSGEKSDLSIYLGDVK